MDQTTSQRKRERIYRRARTGDTVFFIWPPCVRWRNVARVTISHKLSHGSKQVGSNQNVLKSEVDGEKPR